MYFYLKKCSMFFSLRISFFGSKAWSSIYSSSSITLPSSVSRSDCSGFFNEACEGPVSFFFGLSCNCCLGRIVYINSIGFLFISSCPFNTSNSRPPLRTLDSRLSELLRKNCSSWPSSLRFSANFLRSFKVFSIF